MDLSKAIEIIDNIEYQQGKENTVAKGFAILAKYGELDVAAEHDVIWVGVINMPLEDMVAKMSEEDIRELGALHWRIDDTVDSWARFV